ISIFAASVLMADANSSSNPASGYAPLFVPVVGPFIAIGTGRDLHFDRNGGSAALMVFDGIAQTTAFALFLGGVSASKKVYVRDWKAPPWLRLPEMSIGPTSVTGRWTF